VPVSHQDVALFIRSFADLGSESSSARKNPRSRKDTSTVTPSESDSAVRARLRDDLTPQSSKPTSAQMIPQTRHYVDRAVIYDHFKEHFQDKADFMKSVTSTMWNAHGSEYFSNITWVAGSSFGSLGRAITPHLTR